MRRELESDLRKISVTSKILLPLLALTLLSFVAVLVLVPYWTLTSPTSTGASFFGPGKALSVKPGEIASGLLTFADKLRLLAGIGIFSALAIPGLWFAVRLVQSFRRGELFSSLSVRYSRRIAYIFLIYVVLSTVSGLVTTWTPEGFAFSFNPYLFTRDFLILGLIWLFAWIHDAGAVLHEDTEMTI